MSGTPAIDYDLIADPPSTDQLLGIQSPAGTWDLGRYPISAFQAALDTVSKADAEAGTSTTARKWTAERVKEAIMALAPLSSIETFTAKLGNSFVAGEVGFLTAGEIEKAKADAEATTKNMLVMATATINAEAAGVFALNGNVTVTAHGFTIGAPLFISAATAGAITNTRPDTSTNQLRVIGYAVDTNTIRFDPSKTWVEIP